MDEKRGVAAPPPAYVGSSAPPAAHYNAGYGPPLGDTRGLAAGAYGAPQQYGYSSQHAVVTNQPASQPAVVNQVSDYMGLAIFTTFCCCWPLGIVAIMRASESRRCLAAGDLASAQSLSQQSRRFSLFAVVVGLIFFGIVIAVAVLRVQAARETTVYYG